MPSTLRLLFGVVLAAQWPTVARADLPQLSGWPVKMEPGVSGQYLLAPMEGVALVNLLGDGQLEVVASSGDKVWVLGVDGKTAAGWPRAVQGTAQPPPAVGDVDGDGDLELAQVARGLKYSDMSHVHLFHHDGTPVEGWPVSFPNLVFHTVTLADLDGNGGQDVIIQIGEWPPAGTIEVRSGNGQPLGPSWQHALDSYPLAPVAVGDLDGDGALELAYVTLGNLTVRRADGAMAAGFPLAASSGRAYDGGVAMAEISSASKGLELVACDTDSGSGSTARMLAFASDGTPLDGFPVTLASDAAGLGVPTVGDLDGDGTPELVVAVRGKGIAVVGALDSPTKTVKLIATLADAAASIQLVDLDGDGQLELLADNNTADTADGKGYLEAYEQDGTPVTGFPLRPPGSTMSNGASAADLDGDGALELAAVSTVNQSPPESWVSLWSLPAAKAAPAQWATFAHDVRRSSCHGCASKSSPPWWADAGAAEADAGAGDGPAPGPDVGTDGHTGTDGGGSGEGCGCDVSASPAGGGAAWLVLLALLSLVRRRRPTARGRP